MSFEGPVFFGGLSGEAMMSYLYGSRGRYRQRFRVPVRLCVCLCACNLYNCENDMRQHGSPGHKSLRPVITCSLTGVESRSRPTAQ